MLNYLALVDNKHDFGGEKRCDPNKATKKKFDKHWKKKMEEYSNELKKNGEGSWQHSITTIPTGGESGTGFEGDFMEKAFRILSKIKNPTGPGLIKGNLNLYDKNIGTYRNFNDTLHNFKMTEPIDEIPDSGNIYKEFKRFFALEINKELQSFYTCHDSATGSFIWNKDQVNISEEERKKHYVLQLPQNSFDGALGKTYGAEDSRKGKDNYWLGRHVVELDVMNEPGDKRDHWVFHSNIITQKSKKKFIFKIKNPTESNVKITRIEYWAYKILKKFSDYKHQFQIQTEKPWLSQGPLQPEKLVQASKQLLLCEFNGNSTIYQKPERTDVLLDGGKDSDVTFVLSRACAKKFSEENRAKLEGQIQKSKSPEKKTILRKYYDTIIQVKTAIDGCIVNFKQMYGYKGKKTMKQIFDDAETFSPELKEKITTFHENSGKFETGITESGVSVSALCAILNKRKEKYFKEDISKMCNQETICYKIVQKLHTYMHKSLIQEPRKPWLKLDETNLFNIILDLKRAGDWEQALACLHHVTKIKKTTFEGASHPKRCIFFSGDYLCFLFAMLLDIDCIITNNRDKFYFYRSSKSPKPPNDSEPGKFVAAMAGGGKISLTNVKLKHNLIGGGKCDEPSNHILRGEYFNKLGKKWLENFIAPPSDIDKYKKQGIGYFERYHLINNMIPNRDHTYKPDELAKWDVKRAKIVLIVMGLFYELLMSFTCRSECGDTNFHFSHDVINHEILKQSIFYPVVFSKEYRINETFEQFIGLKSIEGVFEKELHPIAVLSYCEHAFYNNLRTNFNFDIRGDLRSQFKNQLKKLSLEALELLGFKKQKRNQAKSDGKKGADRLSPKAKAAAEMLAKGNVENKMEKEKERMKIARAKKMAAARRRRKGAKEVDEGDEEENMDVVERDGVSVDPLVEEVKNLIILQNFLYGGAIKYIDSGNSEEEEIEGDKIDDLSYLKKIHEINYKFYQKLYTIRGLLKKNNKDNSREDIISSCEERQFEHIYFFTEKIHNDIGDCFGYSGTVEPIKFLNGTVIDLSNGDKDKRKKFIKNIAYEFMDLLKRIRSLTLERIFFSNIKEDFIQKILMPENEEEFSVAGVEVNVNQGREILYNNRQNIFRRENEDDFNPSIDAILYTNRIDAEAAVGPEEEKKFVSDLLTKIDEYITGPDYEPNYETTEDLINKNISLGARIIMNTGFSKEEEIFLLTEIPAWANIKVFISEITKNKKTPIGQWKEEFNKMIEENMNKTARRGGYPNKKKKQTKRIKMKLKKQRKRSKKKKTN